MAVVADVVESLSASCNRVLGSMRNAPRWPALTLVVAACCSGCMSVSLKQTLSTLGDPGAYMVRARLNGDVMHYTLTSLHPGSVAALNCVPVAAEEFNGVQYLVHDCVDTASGRTAWMNRFREANEYLYEAVPGLRVTRLEVILLPTGVESVVRAKGVSPPDQVHLQMAFRFHDDQRYLRHAIRSYAHEYVHLGLRASGLEQLDNEEYVAAVAESCVEDKVFGSSSGAIFSDPSKFDVSGMTEAQKESVRSAALAYRDVLREIDRRGSLESLCATLFSTWPAGKRSPG